MQLLYNLAKTAVFATTFICSNINSSCSPSIFQAEINFGLDSCWMTGLKLWRNWRLSNTRTAVDDVRDSSFIRICAIGPSELNQIKLNNGSSTQKLIFGLDPEVYQGYYCKKWSKRNGINYNHLVRFTIWYKGGKKISIINETWTITQYAGNQDAQAEVLKIKVFYPAT